MSTNAKPHIIYLAGKMRGLPDDNYPLFNEYARKLRDAGYVVRNPAEEFEGDHKRTFAEYMRRAHYRLAMGGPHTELGDTCWKPTDAIALLGTDWRDSDGTFFELATALVHGIPAYHVDDLLAGKQSIPRSVIEAHVQFPSYRDAGGYLGPPAAVSGEVRVKDPATGGEKGQKPQQYSLVPMRAWGMVRETWDGITDAGAEWDDDKVGDELPRFLSRFIERDDEGDDVQLLAQGCALVHLLGGPDAALDAVAEVYGYGARKYAPSGGARNWERGYAWSLSIDACYRHIRAYQRGEERDPESGLQHLAHAMFHVLTLLTFMQEGLGTDDRSALYAKKATPPARVKVPGVFEAGDWVYRPKSDEYALVLGVRDNGDLDCRDMENDTRYWLPETLEHAALPAVPHA